MITPRSSLLKHEIINMLFGVLGYHTLDRVEKGSYYCNIRMTKVATGQSMNSHFCTEFISFVHDQVLLL